MKKYIPEINGILRSNMIKVPQIIREASGIIVLGKRIKSLVFTTDIALIKNTNADAIMAVYPFTPQPVITASIMIGTDKPVFCGVGGGITTGKRVVNLALDAEFKGAFGVVVNAPTANSVITGVRKTIDIPLIVTVISEKEDIKSRIDSGASILNVSAGKRTAEVVRSIRNRFPDIPIIATGGSNDESIKQTIDAGANAITVTPPSSEDIFAEIMLRYRKQYEENGEIKQYY
ncbi:response regulator [Clostridium botulinum]|uniref:Hydrolase n=1 Tax=Clostridium botulinum C/D str. DC5 TaxID=1443128 RepID=A0A0A0IG37_CLOBO|nr:response regulator [Clostridium botulinum]KEI03195.1 hydrolase [Clostridium botulinum C/D str. BKT75002]KEI07570.1 hydrolase [Clostridium botulinum C/D str. BKT2873]KGM93783.1 hydrolase [Clostridium botulinum D str. CCUG 7971]KGM99952.1 hydrolase [Clostridium botulinum C/D str. DC5]KOC49732.1 hydrolase [Clostridium botulinum]